MKNYVNESEKLFVQVENDEYAESPREWCNLWTILTWTNNYNSIDDNPYYDLEEFLSDHLTEKQIANLYKGEPSTKEFFERIEKRFYNLGYLVAPISKYEHSQVSYSVGVSQGWDAGVVGVAMVNINDIKKEYGASVLGKGLKEKVYSILDSELNTYNMWANGESYTVSLVNFEGDTIDSLGDMLGYESKEAMVKEYVNYWTDYNFEDFELKELVEKVTYI